jgi:hypothetical protein
LGDKCNAWNHYVHNVADEDTLCHFFVDADVVFSQQCFPLLIDKITKANDSCHIIAGMPLSGRNLEFYQSLVTERFCFFGNLYGPTWGTVYFTLLFVLKLRNKGVLVKAQCSLKVS